MYRIRNEIDVRYLKQCDTNVKENRVVWKFKVNTEEEYGYPTKLYTIEDLSTSKGYKES